MGNVVLSFFIDYLILVVISLTIGTYLITHKEYASYKSTYKKLLENKNDCYQYGSLIYLKGTRIIIFSDNSVKLDDPDGYLHSAFYNYFFIYNIYWVVKYNKLIAEIRKNLE